MYGISEGKGTQFVLFLHTHTRTAKGKVPYAQERLQSFVRNVFIYLRQNNLLPMKLLMPMEITHIQSTHKHTHTMRQPYE